MTKEIQKDKVPFAGHYSDSNNFIYELLQNAEDESADLAVFEYQDDKLIFYHNGTPFDEAGQEFQRTKKELVYSLGDNRKYYLCANHQHLTKFVIFFAKRRSIGSIFFVR